VNPNQVVYDLDNDQVIIPNEEDEKPETEKKLFVKNVSDTKYRKNR
jgi:hypothetical protein